MSWSTAFNDLMPDTVTVKTVTGVSTDGYGTPTYSTAKSYSARVVRKQELVRTFEGTEELATTIAWVNSTSTSQFTPSAEVTLPSGETPPLMNVEAYPDEDGIHHIRLAFGN